MRRPVTALALAVVAVLLMVAPVGAILNGQPDGDGHPYVGVALLPVEGGIVFCSGSLIDATHFVTAAHCFEESGQQVLLTFDPLSIFSPKFPGNLVTGRWFPDPNFCLGCAPGLPGFDTHDVAVIVLDAPVVLDRYAQLPTEGLVDTLGKGAQVDSVGYGLQVREKKLDDDQLLTRYVAVSNVSRSHGRISEEFLKLSANPSQGKGGTCFGDSGGPNLLRGTDTILGINSFGTNSNCAGVSYSYRIDTAAALQFIESFL
ncbi:MAG TPA: trypsin-like serine protease [Thermomicrobiales bacterium]|jgi:hypothetical protein